MPAAEQCGRFPEGGIHQTCKQWRLIKETTSKPRTAAAGGALGCMFIILNFFLHVTDKVLIFVPI